MTLPRSIDERTVLVSIEKLLHAATGRIPIGRVDEVLLRLARRATSASPPYETDVPILASAIWSVLVSQQAFESLEIRGTTFGVSRETTRFEFVRQYASSFVFETPSVEYCLTDPTQSIAECFEEVLIGLLALWRIDAEAFSFFVALPLLIDFCRSLNSRFDDVCEAFLLVLQTIEAAAE